MPKIENLTCSSTKVCSTRFDNEDFVNEEGKQRRLKVDAKPNIDRRPSKKRAKLEEIHKRQKSLADEETRTTSKGEGFFVPTDNKDMISRLCSVDIPRPCLHKFPFEQLCAMCDIEKRKRSISNTIQA